MDTLTIEQQAKIKSIAQKYEARTSAEVMWALYQEVERLRRIINQYEV